MRTKRWVSALIICLLLLAGSTLAAPPAAAASVVTGHVECYPDTTMAVEGVWIAANSGGSGWASWTPLAGQPNAASFSYSLPYGGSYYVHVGCGGSPGKWTLAAYSYNAVSGSGHYFTCYDTAYEDPYYGHCTNT